MVKIVGLNSVSWPHQKIGALETFLINSGNILDNENNSPLLIRDEAKGFLERHYDNPEIFNIFGLNLSLYKNYLKVAECYANKSKENPGGHFDLKPISLFSSVCNYCGTIEIEVEKGEVSFD